MLIKYEWQKLFSGKTKWFLFLLIIVNALLFYLYLVPSASSEEKKLLYNEVKKEVEEKGGIEEVIQELDAQSNGTCIGRNLSYHISRCQSLDQ